MPVLDTVIQTEFITAPPPEDTLVSAVAAFLLPFEDEIKALAPTEYYNKDNVETKLLIPFRQTIVDSFLGAYTDDEAPLSKIFFMKEKLPNNFIPALLSMYDPVSGMTMLHITIGLNNLSFVQFLVEFGSSPFIPDIHGRMPSTLAEICKVDDELLDYVVEHEH